MYFKDLPTKDLLWFRELKHGASSIEQDINNAIFEAENMTELKSKIIQYMAEIMTECAQVIQHTNAMETPNQCTCAQNCGETS